MTRSTRSSNKWPAAEEVVAATAAIVVAAKEVAAKVVAAKEDAAKEDADIASSASLVKSEK